MSKKTCADCNHCQMCQWIDDMVKNSTCDFFEDWKELEKRPHGEWILCSERLPRRDELVLISYRGEVHFCKYLDDGSENAWWSYIHDCCVWNEDVIAWMPLPEPYKKEGEEK